MFCCSYRLLNNRLLSNRLPGNRLPSNCDYMPCIVMRITVRGGIFCLVRISGKSTMWPMFINACSEWALHL